jgi:hypothetical protein
LLKSHGVVAVGRLFALDCLLKVDKNHFLSAVEAQPTAIRNYGSCQILQRILAHGAVLLGEIP